MLQRYTIKTWMEYGRGPFDDDYGDWVDLSDEVERIINELAIKHCKFLELTKCGNVSYNENYSAYMRFIRPFHQKLYVRKKGRYADKIHVYALTEDLIHTWIEKIKYNWFVAPHLPENIGFLFDMNEYLLESITHEGIYCLCLDPSWLSAHEYKVISEYFREDQ